MGSTYLATCVAWVVYASPKCIWIHYFQYKKPYYKNKRVSPCFCYQNYMFSWKCRFYDETALNMCQRQIRYRSSASTEPIHVIRIRSNGIFVTTSHATISSQATCDVIQWHRTASGFAQLMVCCLTAPSHCLTQSWRKVDSSFPVFCCIYLITSQYFIYMHKIVDFLWLLFRYCFFYFMLVKYTKIVIQQFSCLRKMGCSFCGVYNKADRCVCVCFIAWVRIRQYKYPVMV